MAASVARLRDAMAPGSHLVISHMVLAPGHAVGHQPLSETARELGEARKGMSNAAARSLEEVTAFFGDLTLVEPGLTDVWAWRPDSDATATTSEVMTLLGGVARRN